MAEIGNVVAEKVVESLVDSISTQLGYIGNYKSNFEKLEKQLQELRAKNEMVQHLVDEAKRSGEEIEQQVVNWLDDGNKMIDEVTLIVDDNKKAEMKCVKSLCPNLKKRYQHSKNAAVKAKDVSQLCNKGKFDRISYRNIPKEMWHPSSKLYEDFESRMSTLTDVINALSSPNVNVVGVYGMGGIGKTMLAREVGRKAEAEENKVFDSVAFVEVSEQPDVMKIQGAIADKLSLTFREETQSGRARALCERLKLERKVLLILDNIWEGLNLEKVGIPLNDDHRGCKLLLTARNKNVLSMMDCQINFPIGILNDKESWNLFEKITGSCVHHHDLQFLAFDVAKRCGGLPIAIVTIAKALKGKNVHQWKNALLELKRPSSECQDASVTKEAYSCMLLSYNHLKSDELKSTFLLCCTMVLISHAALEELLRYGLGLNLFKRIKTIEEARDRVNTLIQELKDSSLLLGTSNDECFSIHDVVRDVGSVIASNNHKSLIVHDIRDLLARNILENCTSISLLNIAELPKELNCPLLIFFYMKTKTRFSIPDNFFNGMPKLEVLHLEAMDLSKLPASLPSLKNLRKLFLDCCNLGDVAIVGDIKNLEILVLFKSQSAMKLLSEEIGKLNRLRLLDLRRSYFIIPPKTISRLTQLEELYMDDWYDKRQVETNVASLEELKDLCHLTALHISVADAEILPKCMVFQKLKRYEIVIGNDWAMRRTLLEARWSMSIRETSRKLRVRSDTNLCLEDGVTKQLKGIEDLLLDGEQRITNVLYELDGEGFPELKHFGIRNNPFILCIVDSVSSVTCDAFPLLETLSLFNLVRLEKVCHDQLRTKCFCQLRTIEVKECHKLKNLFSFSIAKHLSVLEEIRVVDCWNIEEIFNIVDRADNGVIDLPRLYSLKLEQLPILRRICSETEVASTSQERQMPLTTNASSTEIVLEDQLDDLPLLGEKIVFPNLNYLQLHDINLRRILPNQLSSFSCWVQNLRRMSIRKCSNLKYVFSSSTLGSFNHLQHLRIHGCKDLEELIRIDDNCSNYVEFSSLQKLEIWSCPELREFIFSEKVSYPSLQQIDIRDMANLRRIWPKLCKVISIDCQSLENVFHLQLEVLCVERCGIKEIVGKEGAVEEAAARFSFPQLTTLHLNSLEELKCFYPGKHTMEWPKLKELQVKKCKKIDLFSFQKHDVEGQLDDDPTVRQALFSVDQVVLPHLNYLGLRNINLERTWSNQLPSLSCQVQNLRRMYISECNNSKYVFSSSTLASFSHLQHLHIDDCKDLEELIRFDDNCSNYVEFSSLQKLEIRKCPELREFILSDKVSYPSLQQIDIWSMANLRRIWQRKVIQSVQSCPKLCKVISIDCQSLENVFPASIARGILQLEVLKVVRCGIKEIVGKGVIEETSARFSFPHLTSLSLLSLEELRCFYPGKHTTEWPKLKVLQVEKCKKINLFSFQTQEVEGQLDDDPTVQQALFSVDQVVFPNLNYLRLWNINLKRIWPHQLPSLSCLVQNLRRMSITACNNLKYVFSSSTLGSFNHLQHLQIKDCKDLEELISIDDKYSNYVEFPSLQELEIFSCSELKEFIFSDKVSYPNLQQISIWDMTSLRRIWQSQVIQSIQYCPKLCNVRLNGCRSLENIFPASIARSLLQLKVLRVVFCGIKEIVGKEGGVEEAATRFSFPQLTSLYLEDLNEVRCFYPGEYTMEWPNLKELNVSYCRKIRCLFNFQKQDVEGQLDDDSALQQALFSVDQEILPHGMVAPLKTLRLSCLRSLKQIWKQESKMELHLQLLEVSRCHNLINVMPPSASYKDLKILKVDHCDRLISLIPPSASATKSLMVLEEMSIKFCKEMTEIIENQGDVMEGKITLSRLKSLELEELTKFKSFYSGNYTFNFPLLEKLIVTNCPNMKFLSSGAISTPNLVEVWQDRANYKCEHPNLNATFKQIYDKKVFSILEQSFLSGNGLRLVWFFSEYTKVFSNTKQLELSGNDIGIMWQIQFPKHIFPKLKCLHISNDKSTVSPFRLFQRFLDIEKLQLTNCSYEEIFSYEEIEKYACFPTQIKYLRLDSLDDVKQMWKKDSKLNILQNLESLEVWRCKSLNNVMLPSSSFENLKIMKVNRCEKLIGLIVASTIKSLVQLEEMQISHCRMMIQVVANGGHIVEDKIIFHKLKKLKLNDLSCLTSFSFGNYTFEIPFLEKLTVKKCPMMEIFALGNLSTPILREVWQDQKEYLCKDDLNEIVRQHHEEMIFSRKQLGFKNITMMLQKTPKHQKVFFNLELLSFKRDEMDMLWQSQFPQEVFPRLKLVEVFEDESTVSPLAILQRFQSVDELELNCSSYEEMFSYEDFEKYGGALAQIKRLSLYGLDNLKQMWKQDSSFDLILQNIENLKVEWCGSLVTLMPPSSSFQNLTSLSVEGCDGLMNLLAPATAKSLVQLRFMSIRKCKTMTEVISSNEESVTDDEIIFSRLRTLKLDDLSSLSSVCPGNYTITFPCLWYLSVEKCPKIKSFSSGVLKAPWLDKIWHDNDIYYFCDDGLNAAIQEIHEKLNVRTSLKDCGGPSTLSSSPI